MKLICGLLAVALLGCLADAQYYKPQKPSQPQQPQQPQQPERPKYQPQQPQQPQQPERPKYQPQQPQQPERPKYQPQQPQQPQQQRPQPKYPQSSKQLQEPETFHSCEVLDSSKIQCGASGISATDCDHINCCFDGQMCYYGRHVTLQCTKDGQFIVVVARDATLPNLDLETIYFHERAENCEPVGVTTAFAIYQFPVTACGTVMTEEPGVIIYENRMTSSFEVAMGPYGTITRDSSYELLVQCRYIGTSVEALIIEVGLVPPPPPVAAPGPLRVELRLANGECTTKGCVEEEVAYYSFYTDGDYPVTKVLREPVYVEVRMLERTDPNLVLTLGRCWATSSPYPHSLPQWDLLIDGCPYRDDNYLTTLVPVGDSSGLMYPTHHRRFIFKMFTFVSSAPADQSKQVAQDPGAMTPLKEQIYIHCDTAVCQPSLGNNCEPRCFRKKREIGSSVQKSLRQETTVVSSQGIVFSQGTQ